jgi:TM2 domain-containing membrane protein YozV
MPRELFPPGSVRVADIMASPGSTGNVIAALASFFIPGLGQLLQGKLFRALIMFVLAGFLWWFYLGWIIHLWSVIDAALYRRPEVR